MKIITMNRFWQAYFFLWIFIQGTQLQFSFQLALLEDSFPVQNFFDLDFFVKMLATIGLYCYAWKKKIFPAYVWKTIFVLYISIFIYDFFINWTRYNNMFGSKGWGQDLTTYYLVMFKMLVPLFIFNALIIIALFLHAFNSYEIKLSNLFTGKNKNIAKIVLISLFSFSAIFLVRTFYKGFYTSNSRMQLILELKKEELNKARNTTNKSNSTKNNTGK